MKWGAIVLAAGQGRRMHSRVAKQFLLLNGRPVIYYALKAFEESQAESVVLVTGEEEIPYFSVQASRVLNSPESPSVP